MGLLSKFRNTYSWNIKFIKIVKIRVFFYKGNLLVKLEMYHEALESYDKALCLNPNDISKRAYSVVSKGNCP
jgi:tetratricopeptide (TPR) repeat protein